MIDPRDVTNFNRTEAELQEFWLFCLVVAGKKAMTQARLLDSFLEGYRSDSEQTPFDILRSMQGQGLLGQQLRDSRLGQYTRLERAFVMSLTLDLKTCSAGDLEALPGVGSKTARFFLLHTRPNQQIAVLDTHVLHHMRDLGLTTQKGTPPTGKKYDDLEKEFIKLANASGMSIADYDLHIWRTYSGNEL